MRCRVSAASALAAASADLTSSNSLPPAAMAATRLATLRPASAARSAFVPLIEAMNPGLCRIAVRSEVRQSVANDKVPCGGQTVCVAERVAEVSIVLVCGAPGSMSLGGSTGWRALPSNAELTGRRRLGGLNDLLGRTLRATRRLRTVQQLPPSFHQLPHPSCEQLLHPSGRQSQPRLGTG